jgi:hypothetical protein
MICCFSPEFGDINLGELTISCCLNHIFECINGFNLLKNPWGTKIMQTSSLKSRNPTISHLISVKFKRMISPKKNQRLIFNDWVLIHWKISILIKFVMKVDG